MPRKAWIGWTLTGKGYYAPSLHLDDLPGTMSAGGVDPDFATQFTEITDPELLAHVLNSDGGVFGPVIKKYPAPVRERDPIAVYISSETRTEIVEG